MIERPISAELLFEDCLESLVARLEEARKEKADELVYMMTQFIEYPVEANQEELITALTRYRHLWMRSR